MSFRPMSMEGSLPQEVLAVLPTEPYAQVELAHKIVHFSFSQKVAQLEAETQHLREVVLQKQNVVKTLERRVSGLEVEVQELQAKNKQALDEQHRLQGEKGALIETVKKLNKDVARLESFKKNLLQHLQEDDETAKIETSFTAVDLSAERLIAEALTASRTSMQNPPSVSTKGYGPLGYAVSPSPIGTSGRQGNNSPPQLMNNINQTESPRVDGKEFFKQARSRLSYEQFNQFLQNIKELNAGRITRDETLRRARDLLGVAHSDLFGMFETLLSRHMMMP